MDGDLFNVGKRVFHGTGKAVLRQGAAALRRFYCGFGRFRNARAFKRRNFDNRAADCRGQRFDIQSVAVFADNVNHIDGDDNGNPEFGQLGSQIKISL